MKNAFPPVMVAAGWALAASLCFSINDSLIKFLAGNYALHQVVFTRSIVGVALLCLIVIPLSGGFSQIKTNRPGAHLFRAGLVVLANVFFYMALADMGLAEVVGIFFVAPFLITIFSVVFLGETVGPWRWFAIFFGFLGVMLILRPGTEAFRLVSLLPILAASCYAGLHIMTRQMRDSETIMALTFSPPLVFALSSGMVGLVLGTGAFEGSSNASLAFLTRAWVWPSPGDLMIMVFIGFGVTFGGYAIAQAYIRAEAALVAPFEYTGLIYAAFFGYLYFGEWPDTLSWFGMAIVMGSGLFMIWREAVNSRVRRGPPNAPR